MPNPLKGLGVAVTEGRVAIRELLNIIKEGAKKDPARIFMAERQTANRIGPTPDVIPPKGFSLGGTDPRMTRSPALVEKRKLQEQLYSQAKPVGKESRTRWNNSTPESVSALEELGNVTRHEGPRATPAPSGKWGYGKDQRAVYEPSVRDAVLRDASGKGSLWTQTKELAVKYPNVKPNTIVSWLKGEGGKRKK